MNISTFLSSTLVIGLLEATPLILAAIGFTLIYRLNGFTNIAYAENLTIGAYIAVAFNTMLGMNFYASIIPAALLTGLLSSLTYLLVFRPAIRRGVGSTELIILSTGLSYFLRYGSRLVFGNDLFNFDFGGSTFMKVFGIGVTSVQIISIILVVLITIALYLFMYKTNFGQMMRALADNEDLARVSGINPSKVSVLIWFLSGICAGLAGIFFGTFSFISSSLGWNKILIIIMVSIVGGVGNVGGALITAIGLGFVTTAVTLLTPQALYGDIILLIIFIFVLKLKKVRV